MKINSDTFWVPAIAYLIAAICTVWIGIIVIQYKRKYGRWPIGSSKISSSISNIALITAYLDCLIPKSVKTEHWFSIILMGFYAAVVVMSLVFILLVLSQSIRKYWSYKIGLQQLRSIIIPIAIIIYIVLFCIKPYKSILLLQPLSILAAILFIPYFIHLAYNDYTRIFSPYTTNVFYRF